MGDFIGHISVLENFIKRVKGNNISHANLIIGEDGLGKSIIANIFARHILGVGIDRDYIDIIKYKTSKASFGVDEVRDLIEEVHKKPYEGSKKVIIIYDSNKLTVQAQNALLKTIEEPPAGVYIILLSDSGEILLDTIKSRCQIYKLFPLKKEEIEMYLERNYFTLEESEKRAAIGYSEGIPGKVDKFVSSEELKELRLIVLDLLSNINHLKIANIIKFEKSFTKFKSESNEVLNMMVSFIRDIMIIKSCDNKEILVNNDKLEILQNITNNISYKKLNSLLSKIEEARKNLLSNTNFDTTIRVMLMGFMEG